MKTICIYHSRDLDGWMSAAIVKKWFIENNQNNTSWIILEFDDKDSSIQNINQELRMLGWDYGEKVPDLSKYDKVIMVDINFPKDEMFNLFFNNKSMFTWIDHHTSAINENKSIFLTNTKCGLRDEKFAACELTWKYYFPYETMPEVVRLLGRYDCFGHKGTDEEQEVLEFQYAARASMSNYEDCYNALKANQDHFIPELLEAGDAIYKYLCTEAKQIYSKAFPVKFIEYPNDVVNNSERKFLCVNQERFNPINFDIDYHKDGYDGFACFWYKDNKWTFSLYNDNGKVDCSVICKQYGGGGHKGAAGFVTDDINLIINSKKL